MLIVRCNSLEPYLRNYIKNYIPLKMSTTQLGREEIFLLNVGKKEKVHLYIGEFAHTTCGLPRRKPQELKSLSSVWMALLRASWPSMVPC